MKRRIRNLIIRLADGEDLFTNLSPRITYDEIREIDKLVDSLQIESLHGAEVRSPRLVFPLRLDEFRKKAIIVLEN